MTPYSHNSDQERVFTFKGKPIGSIRKAFKNSCNRAGIKNLTFHTLRHTFATRLVLSGVDLATVSKLLGHSTIQMTMRYSHPTPEALKNAVSKLDK
ncbi:MAG: tyrosine-type recombinase/integrase [Candidatus Dadabacteria bacterium]